MDLHEAAEKALEALEITTAFVDGCPIDWGRGYVPEADEAINALRAALAEAEEPVAWQSRARPTLGGNSHPWRPWKECTKDEAEDYRRVPVLNDWEREARALYTHPPRREPLTEEQIKAIIDANWDADFSPARFGRYVARAIERAHGIGGDE